MLLYFFGLAFVVVANALAFFEWGSATLVCLWSCFFSSCPPLSHRFSLILLPVLDTVLATSAASFSLRPESGCSCCFASRWVIGKIFYLKRRAFSWFEKGEVSSRSCLCCDLSHT